MIYKCLLALLIHVSLVTAEYCYVRGTYRYCAHGCCGDYHSTCCNSAVSAIAGGISGTIALIAIIVVCCCCCVRRRRNQGTMVYGAGQHHVVVSTVQYPQPGAYPPPGVYPQPGMYPQQPMGPVGGYPQPPPPTGNQPSNFQGYTNTGYSADPVTNQTQQKSDAPAPPPPYEP